MYKFSFFIFLFFQTLSFAQLISYEKINSFTIDDIYEKWSKKDIPRSIAPIKFSVDVYNVLYYTEWHDGSLVQASGLYMLPRNSDDISLVVYNHGTRLNPNYRDIKLNREGLIALIFATDGYAVIIPDYVGLGEGKKTHLYMHADSEANAGIYFLKSLQDINKKLNIRLNNQLFITGYSQGGHAALALHKKLQDEYSDFFPVTASSPMSGPYDPLDIQGRVMFKSYTQPHYLTYLLTSYNEVYGMVPKDQFYNIFKAPYDSVVFKYFSSNANFNSGGSLLDDINNALPDVPVDMINDEIVERYHSEYNFMKVFIEQNNVYDWKPNAPVQLCYCKSDEEVLYENSLLAYDVMRKNGAKNITKLCVSRKYNHVECAGFSSIHTKYFFDSFRKGSKKGRKGPIFKRFIVKMAKIFK